MQLDGIPRVIEDLQLAIRQRRCWGLALVEFEGADGLAALAGGALPRAVRDGIAPPGSGLPDAMHSTIASAISWFIRSE